jgi:hypothetical protein
MENSEKIAIREALKEVARWLFFYVIAWLVSATLAQIELVPEFASVKIWVFTYSIPIRTIFHITLTLVGRMADKFIHEWDGTKLRGLLWF